MYQQYLNQAQAAIGNLSSDELKELLNDDEKLEMHVNDAVSWATWTISLSCVDSIDNTRTHFHFPIDNYQIVYVL